MYKNELILPIKGRNTELQGRGFFFPQTAVSIFYLSALILKRDRWKSKEKRSWFYWMLESRLNNDIDLWHIVISPSLQILLSPHCFTGNNKYSLFRFHRNFTSPFLNITFWSREAGYLFLSNCLINTIS